MSMQACNGYRYNQKQFQVSNISTRLLMQVYEETFVKCSFTQAYFACLFLPFRQMLIPVCTCLQNSELQDRLAAAETEAAELKNQVDDLEYQLSNANHRVDKLDRHLADAVTKVKSYEANEVKVPTSTASGATETVTKPKVQLCIDTVCISVKRL